MAVAKGTIEQYLQEGLLALVPVYDNNGDRSFVYTLQGRHQEPRSVRWLVEKIAACYSLNLIELRRRCGTLLGLKHNISLPITENLILLPVKVRQAAVPGETTIGYLNMVQVEELLPPEDESADGSPVWLSRIRLKGGLELGALNTADTLRLRLHQGQAVREDLLKRRDHGAGYTGLSRQALLSQLPNCDCVLKELFMELFGLDLEEEKKS